MTYQHRVSTQSSSRVIARSLSCSDPKFLSNRTSCIGHYYYSLVAGTFLPLVQLSWLRPTFFVFTMNRAVVSSLQSNLVFVVLK